MTADEPITLQPPPDPAAEGSWATRLTDGETLLWTGAPTVAFHTTAQIASWTLQLFTFFAVTALFIGGPMVISEPDLQALGLQVPLFGLPLVGIPPALLFFAVATRRRLKRLRSAFYSLTNERAVIGYTWPLKSRVIFHLKPDSPVFHGTWTHPASVFFSKKTSGTKWFPVRIYEGFYGITDAQKVLDLVNQIKSGALDRAPSPDDTCATQVLKSP